MSCSIQRCIFLRGGPREVVITELGAAAVPQAAAEFLRERAANLIDADFQRHLASNLELDSLTATMLVAELRQIGLLGSGEHPKQVEATTVEIAWDTFAMLPRQAAALARTVVSEDARVVVEFGAGTSTVALAAAASLRTEPSTLLSFEQDPDWAARLAGPLACVQSPMADVVVERCHLRSWPGRAALPINRWYDLQIVTAALERLPAPVDLLVVDGPTAFRQEWRFDRYPALPVVRGFLAPGAQILLDDTRRAGEQAVFGQWLQELGPQWYATSAGRGTWLREAISR